MKRWIQSITRLGAFALVASALVGCDFFGSQDHTNASSELGALDIADAKSLFIAPAPGASSAARGLQASGTDDTKRKTLFKVTDGGVIKQVTYLDKNGKKVTVTKRPTAVHQVNATYLIVVFDHLDGYLIRRGDGAAFPLQEFGQLAGYRQHRNFLNAPEFQTDAAGNLYYRARANGSANPLAVVRIGVTNPQNLTARVYARVGGSDVEGFWVSPRGDVIYGSGRNNAQIHRIGTTAGRVYTLPSGTAMPFWLGADGHFKYVNPLANTKVTTVEVEESDDVTSRDVTATGNILTSALSSYLFRFGSRTIAVDRDPHAGTPIVKLENGTSAPGPVANIVPSEIKTITTAFASPNYYYLAGENAANEHVLIRVDPQSDATLSMLPEEEYDVYKADASKDDVITFNAQRLSDGKFVIGEVSSPGGEVKILKDDLGGTVVNLIRVN